MALTVAEKMELDGKLHAHLNDFIEKGGISLNEIQSLCGNYSTTSILAGFNRLCKTFETNDNSELYMQYHKYEKTFSFKYGKRYDPHNYSFCKEKNLLYFGCFDGLCYDFITKSFNMDVEDFVNYSSYWWDNVREVLPYEWMFNYTDSIDIIFEIIRNVDKEYYEKMPTGFFKVLQESDRPLSADLLIDYVYNLKYGKYAKFVRGLDDDKVVNRFMTAYSCDASAIYKMIIKDIANGIFDYRGNYCEYLEDLTDASDYYTLDLNRGLLKNVQLLRELQKARKDEILTAQLQRLNFINGLQIDDYTVVVPQSQADKLAEGRMQNNCVGYYYDETIIKGQNLIYFLRKTNNVEHSYITCRYAVAQQKTVEARKVNNSAITDTKEYAILDRISEIIRENLSK